MEKWKDINWTIFEIEVFELQQQIYDASLKKDKSKVRGLQRKLLKLNSAKLIAVKKITQGNRDKKRSGVEGVKSLNETECIDLARTLRLDGKTEPIKRVYLPQSNGKLRLLGIPSLTDRAKQCLVKMVIEPEWEAKFDTNSYGFRPGYSIADAKWALARQLQGVPKYFLNVDIKGCFDLISHAYLIKKLDTLKMLENQIDSWLKAGIFEYTARASTVDPSDFENLKGTPQNEVLSPLLVNIALNGIEPYVMQVMKKSWNVKLVRYADEIVALAKQRSHIEAVKQRAMEYLEPIGLELSKEKTKIGHSTKVLDGQRPGFVYLNYNFRVIKCSRHQGVKNNRSVAQPFRLQTRPSLKAVKVHKKAILKTLRDHKTASMKAVIEALARKIRGWVYYHSMTQATQTFTALDRWLWKRLWNWAKKRQKTATKAKKHCFSVMGWQFGFIERVKEKKDKKWVLKRYDQIKVRVFVKIKANASIYNRTQTQYFVDRLKQHHPIFRKLGRLITRQNGKCAHCNQYLRPDQIIELHYPLDNQGKRNGEIKFVHEYCHDIIHRNITRDGGSK